MENKTTIELIGLINSGKGGLVDGNGSITDMAKYEEAWAELRQREPFYTILNEDYGESLPAAWVAIKELQDEIKKLKRHKHDPQTGDVLVRI